MVERLEKFRSGNDQSKLFFPSRFPGYGSEGTTFLLHSEPSQSKCVYNTFSSEFAIVLHLVCFEFRFL
jgi:hypothetical protein